MTDIEPTLSLPKGMKRNAAGACPCESRETFYVAVKAHSAWWMAESLQG